MRHITDGELHAYLDGALDHLPFHRGEEVREHLDACGACRERLEDEREVRSRTEDLLALAAPEERPAPSFEDIRARAETAEAGRRSAPPPARARGLFRGVHLGWAATVILALGVGWMGGQIWQAAPPASQGMPEPPSPGLRQASTADSPGGAVDRDRQRPEEALESRSEDAEARAESDRSTTTDVLDEEVAGAENADAAAAESAVAAGDVSEAGVKADVLAGAAGEPVPAAPMRDLTADPAMERNASSRPSAPPAFRSAKAPSAEAEASILTRGEVASDQNSLAVPGLEVLSVEWEEWAPGDRALYIQQLLPMGDTLELRYLGLLMGTDPEVNESPLTQGRVVQESMEKPLSPKVMEASLPPGWNQVVMRWRRGWLVARAPLPTETLRGILRSVH